MIGEGPWYKAVCFPPRRTQIADGMHQTKGATIIPKLRLGKDGPLTMTALSGSPKAEATLVSIGGMNKM